MFFFFLFSLIYILNMWLAILQFLCISIDTFTRANGFFLFFFQEPTFSSNAFP